MSTEPVLVAHPFSHVVQITLNRPERLNAINVPLLRALTDALRKHASSHVIILQGAGDRAFCAGEDLKDTLAPKTNSAEELRVAFHLLQDITRLTSSASALVVAAVQGFAIGGGAEIALAADFVIGGPNTQFRFPEVTLGHAVTGGISLRLSQMVGLLKAKDLLLRGRTVAPDEALAIGLLTEVAEDPKSRAEQLAVELSRLPRAAAASLKTSLERSVFPNMETVLHEEVNAASFCFAQTEAANAFKNFATRKNGEAPVRDLNTALATAVQKHPQKVFLRSAGQDVTFADFARDVTALARGLRKIGVKAGGRVLVMMRNSIEMVHTWMATNRVGAIWIPVNTEWKSLTLKNAVISAEAEVAIVDDEFVSQIQETGQFSDTSIYVRGESHSRDLTQLYHHRDLGTSADKGEGSAASPATTSAFLYTSGSTGRSKPCVLSHEYFIIQARLLIENCDLRTDDVLYCPFPLFHADATALTVIPALLLGATAALSVRFTASRFWDEIRETKATVYDFMGATLAMIYRQPPSPRDRDHRVRLAWGVPVPPFAEAYEQRFGHPLKTLYGSVEASIPIVQHGELVPGSCGMLRPGFQLRIGDDHDEPLGSNTPGQLLLRSDNSNAFFQGYFNNPDATLQTYKNMWLHTGDIAKIDNHGNVFFLGRMKDMIRRRGENISASEVEGEFLQHPDVVIAAAFAISSQLGPGTEDDLKVAIKLRSGSTTTEEDLWYWSRKNMARHQVPTVIEIVQELKRTPTEKIEKGSLTADGGRRFLDRLIKL